MVGTGPVQVSNSNSIAIPFSQTQTVYATAVNADGFMGQAASYEAILHSTPVVSHQIQASGEMFGDYYTGVGTLSFSATQPVSEFYLDFGHISDPPLLTSLWPVADITQVIDLTHGTSNEFRFQYRMVDIYGFSSSESGLISISERNLPLLTTVVTGVLDNNYFEQAASVEFLLSSSTDASFILYTLDGPAITTSSSQLSVPQNLLLTSSVNLQYQGFTTDGFDLGSGQIVLNKLPVPENLLVSGISNRQYYKNAPVVFDVEATGTDSFSFFGGTGPLSVNSAFIATESVFRIVIETVPMGVSTLQLVKTSNSEIIARQRLEIRHPVINTLDGDGIGFRSELLRKQPEVWIAANNAGDILISDSIVGDVVRISSQTGATERMGWFVDPLDYQYTGKPGSVDLLPLAETTMGTLVFVEDDSNLTLVATSETGPIQLLGDAVGTDIKTLDGTENLLDGASIFLGTQTTDSSALFEIANRVYFSLTGSLYSYDGTDVRWDFGGTPSGSAVWGSSITTVVGYVATAEKIDEESYLLFVDDNSQELFKAYKVFVSGIRSGEFDLIATFGSGLGVDPSVLTTDPLELDYYTISAAAWVNSGPAQGLYVLAGNTNYSEEIWFVESPTTIHKVLGLPNSFYGELPAKSEQFRYSPTAIFGAGGHLGIHYTDGYDDFSALFNPASGDLSPLVRKGSNPVLNLSSLSLNQDGDMVGIERIPGRLEASQNVLLVRKNQGLPVIHKSILQEDGYGASQYFQPMHGPDSGSAFALKSTSQEVLLLKANYTTPVLDIITMTMSEFLTQGYASNFDSFLIEESLTEYDTLAYAVSQGLSLNQIAIPKDMNYYYHAATQSLYVYYWAYANLLYVYKNDLKQNPIPVSRVMEIPSVLSLPDAYVLSSAPKLSVVSDAIILQSFGSVIVFPTSTGMQPYMLVKSSEDSTNGSNYGAEELAGSAIQIEGVSKAEIHVLWDQGNHEMAWLDFSGRSKSEVLTFLARTKVQDNNTLYAWPPVLSGKPLQGVTVSDIGTVYINQPHLLHSGKQAYIAAYGLKKNSDLLSMDMLAGPKPLLQFGTPQVTPTTTVLTVGAEIAVPVSGGKWNYVAYDGSVQYQSVATNPENTPTSLRLVVDAKTGSIETKILAGTVAQDRFGRRSEPAPGLNVPFEWSQDALLLVPEINAIAIEDFVAQIEIDGTKSFNESYRDFYASPYTLSVAVRVLLPNNQYFDLDDPMVYALEGGSSLFHINDHDVPENALQIEYVLTNPKGDSAPFVQNINRHYWVTVAGHRGSYMPLDGNRMAIKSVKSDGDGNTYILDFDGNLYTLGSNGIVVRLKLTGQPPLYNFPEPVNVTSFAIHPASGTLYVQDGIILYRATEPMNFDPANYSNLERSHFLEFVEEFFTNPTELLAMEFHGDTLILFGGGQLGQANMLYADVTMPNPDWFKSTVSGGSGFNIDCLGCEHSVIGAFKTSDTIKVGYKSYTDGDGDSIPSGRIIEIPDPMLFTNFGNPSLDQEIPTTEIIRFTQYSVAQRLTGASTDVLGMVLDRLYSILPGATTSEIIAVVGSDAAIGGIVVTFVPDSQDIDDSPVAYIAGSYREVNPYAYRMRVSDDMGGVRAVNRIHEKLHLTMWNYDLVRLESDDYISPIQTIHPFQEALLHDYEKAIPAYSYRKTIKKAYPYQAAEKQGYVLLTQEGELAWLDTVEMTVAPYPFINGFVNLFLSEANGQPHLLKGNGTVYAVSVTDIGQTILKLEPVANLPQIDNEAVIAAKDMGNSQWLVASNFRIYSYNQANGDMQTLNQMIVGDNLAFLDMEYLANSKIFVVMEETQPNYLRRFAYRNMNDVNWSYMLPAAQSSFTIHKSGNYLYYAAELAYEQYGEIGIVELSQMNHFLDFQVEGKQGFEEHRSLYLWNSPTAGLIYTGDANKSRQLFGFEDWRIGYQLKQKQISPYIEWPIDETLACQVGDITHIVTNPVPVGNTFKISASCNLPTTQMLTGSFNGTPLVWGQFENSHTSELRRHSWRSEVLNGSTTAPFVSGIQPNGLVSIFDRTTFGNMQFSSLYNRSTKLDLKLNKVVLTKLVDSYDLRMDVSNNSTEAATNFLIHLNNQDILKEIETIAYSINPMESNTLSFIFSASDLPDYLIDSDPLMVRIQMRDIDGRLLEDADPRDNYLVRLPARFNLDSDSVVIKFADLAPGREITAVVGFNSQPMLGITTEYVYNGIRILAQNPGVHQITLQLLDSSGDLLEVEFTLTVETKGFDLVLKLSDYLLRPNIPKQVELTTVSRSGNAREFSVPVPNAAIDVSFGVPDAVPVTSSFMQIEALTQSSDIVELDIRQTDFIDSNLFVDKPIQIQAREMLRASGFTNSDVVDPVVVPLAGGYYAVAWIFDGGEIQPEPGDPTPPEGIYLRIFDADGNSNSPLIPVVDTAYNDTFLGLSIHPSYSGTQVLVRHTLYDAQHPSGGNVLAIYDLEGKRIAYKKITDAGGGFSFQGSGNPHITSLPDGGWAMTHKADISFNTVARLIKLDSQLQIVASSAPALNIGWYSASNRVIVLGEDVIVLAYLGSGEATLEYKLFDINTLSELGTEVVTTFTGQTGYSMIRSDSGAVYFTVLQQSVNEVFRLDPISHTLIGRQAPPTFIPLSLGSLAITSFGLAQVGVSQIQANYPKANYSAIWSDGVKTLLASQNRIEVYDTEAAWYSSTPSLVVTLYQMAAFAAHSEVNDQTVHAIQSIWSDGTKILLGDYFDSRVLVFNNWFNSENPEPDTILSGFRPKILQSDSTKVAVWGLNSNIEDELYFYDDWPTSVGEAPARTIALGFPVSAMYSDGNITVVADDQFDRLSVWESWPLTDNQAQDFYIGETGTSENEFSDINALHVVDDVLLVSDSGNYRILGIPFSSLSSSSVATLVLGQSDFVSNRVRVRQPKRTVYNVYRITNKPGGGVMTLAYGDQSIVKGYPTLEMDVEPDFVRRVRRDRTVLSYLDTETLEPTFSYFVGGSLDDFGLPVIPTILAHENGTYVSWQCNFPDLSAVCLRKVDDFSGEPNGEVAILYTRHQGLQSVMSSTGSPVHLLKAREGWFDEPYFIEIRHLDPGVVMEGLPFYQDEEQLIEDPR